MSGPEKPKDRAGLSEIEAALEGLLGKLGGTLADLVEKLESGEAGELRRSATFDSGRGPVRAETGIRIRVGGRTLGGEGAPGEAAQPAARPKAAGPGTGAARPDGLEPRPVTFDTYVAGGRWIASAEVPGIGLDDVVLRTEGGVLRLETTGRRRFGGAVDLPADAETRAIETVLRNGILEVSVRIDGEGPE